MQQIHIGREAGGALCTPIAAFSVNISADRNKAMKRAKGLHAVAGGIDAMAADKNRRPGSIQTRSFRDVGG